MANKVQAKAAVDSAATAIKSDIDNILPTGVNVTDGRIDFNPTRWGLRLDAGGSMSTAESWISSITTALTGASRTFTVRRSGRRADDATNDGFRIETQLAIYTIVNVR